jgi:hypothetical protein
VEREMPSSLITVPRPIAASKSSTSLHIAPNNFVHGGLLVKG